MNIFIKMTSIKDRYDFLIDHFSGGNKRLFARSIGVSPSVIENIVGTRQTNPSFEILQKTLIAYENINANWLINGNGIQLVEKKESTSNKECERCQFHEDLIEALRQQITDKQKLIDYLEEHSPNEAGQKRKASA